MANIRDIAKLTGYSASTVSRAINHSGYVSKVAEQKIEKVIEELDYAPNSIARDLSSGKTLNVGVVVPHMDHPYFTQIVAGIMRSAFAAQYNVVMLQSNYDAELEIKYLELLHRKALDALIFTSHGISLKRLAEYQKYGAVVCCEEPQGVNIAAAFALRQSTYREAFVWLKRKSYQRIGILLSRAYEVSATSQMTLDTFKEVFGKLPLKELVNTHVTTFRDGYTAAAVFKKINPDFIFTNGDDVAAGVHQYYAQHGLQVPPLIGQENQLASQLLQIPTIDHRCEKVGQLAFELAFSHEIKQVPVASDFVIRGENSLSE